MSFERRGSTLELICVMKRSQSRHVYCVVYWTTQPD